MWPARSAPDEEAPRFFGVPVGMGKPVTDAGAAFVTG